MEIDLEYPFSKDWDKGTVRMCDDGRRRITLWRGKTRKGMSYARYLKSVQLGRYLLDDEHVDHRDEDRSNDVVSNLQILTPRENAFKSAIRNQRLRAERGDPVDVEVICAVCTGVFTKPVRLVRYATRNGTRLTCSKHCAGRLSKTNPGPSQTKIQVSGHVRDRIIEMRRCGKSDYDIADDVGMSRSKVYRYRKESDID